MVPLLDSLSTNVGDALNVFKKDILTYADGITKNIENWILSKPISVSNNKFIKIRRLQQR